MTKIAVVTTFHKKGLETYGQRMINTFCANWPKEVSLYVYPEKCTPHIPDANQVITIDLDTVSDLTNFKTKWKDIPKANGDVSLDPIRSKRKDSGKGFKWDAVRFAHKVYAIFDCAARTDADILLWMDADTVCHSPVTFNAVSALCTASADLSYLGREGKYSECGLYAMNLKSPIVLEFLKEFKRFYDQAEDGIFQLEEWHDSFVFDAVRHKFPTMKQQNWSAGIIKGEGHPLINSQWGAYLDHLKGNRKSAGRSLDKDLTVKRNEAYWK